MPDAAHHTRREFLALLGAGSGALIAACDGAFTLPTRTPPDTSHLAARRQPPTGTVTPGLHPLGLATGRDGALYVPAGYAPTMSAPLIILCHGAGGSSTQWTGDTNLLSLLDQHGVVAIIPESRGTTWDLLGGGFGVDVSFLDAALTATYARVNIDASRQAIAGFSDGGSWALSLGISNGDLFAAVLGFSAGFLAPGAPRGKPRIFLSHGMADAVLPKALTGDVIAQRLRDNQYDVTYDEFAGGHEVPDAVEIQALTWLG